MCAPAAGEWEICGDRFYEKRELYSMAWGDVKLDQMRYCPMPITRHHLPHNQQTWTYRAKSG